MKQTLGLLGLLGVSQPVFAEDSVRLPEIVDCQKGNTLYRLIHPHSEAILEVYAIPDVKQNPILIDRFSLENPDEVFGHRLDLVLGYIEQCLEKEKK